MTKTPTILITVVLPIITPAIGAPSIAVTAPATIPIVPSNKANNWPRDLYL